MYVYIITESHRIERNYEQRDVSIQTSLSSTSPRKSRLRKQLIRARSKIQKLEAVQKKKHIKIDMDVLDTAVDNFFPPETANFLKAQARLFQQMNKGRRYTPAFKQQFIPLFFQSERIQKLISFKVVLHTESYNITSIYAKFALDFRSSIYSI